MEGKETGNRGDRGRKGDLRSGDQVGIVKHWELDVQLVETTHKRLLAPKGQGEGENKVNGGREGVLRLVTENRLQVIVLTRTLEGLDLTVLNQGGLEGNWTGPYVTRALERDSVRSFVRWRACMQGKN